MTVVTGGSLSTAITTITTSTRTINTTITTSTTTTITSTITTTIITTSTQLSSLSIQPGLRRRPCWFLTVGHVTSALLFFSSCVSKLVSI